MSKLTREQIRKWRNQHESSYGHSDFIDALCDMALQSLADAEDAERYRWLSSRVPPDIYYDIGIELDEGGQDELDAAIDAARGNHE